MNKHQKLLDHILMKKGDDSVSFNALSKMLVQYGFQVRIKGDHHIFTRDGLDEIINLQPLRSKAKSYQVRQVRGIFLRYGIHQEE